MDLFTAFLDVLFIALLIVMYVPTGQPTSAGPRGDTAPMSPLMPGSPYISLHQSASGRSTPSPSPLPRGFGDTLKVPSPHRPIANSDNVDSNLPTIVLTDHGRRPAHKRKSVSFSLSSIEDLTDNDDASGGGGCGGGHKKRPPTPFVSGLASPSQRKIEEEPSAGSGAGGVPRMPGTPLTHSVHYTDPMGVQKKWLMA